MLKSGIMLSIEGFHEIRTGFLLFDKQVQSYRAWLVFKQNPGIQFLESEKDRIREQLLQIPGEVREKEKEFSKRLGQIQPSLDEARVFTRQATILKNSRSFIGKLYRVVNKFVPSIAEQIIPYESPRRKLQIILDKKREIEEEGKKFKIEKALEQTSLARRKVEFESAFEELSQNWLFYKPERVLFYSLTHLPHNPEARKKLLLQYCRYSGTDIDEIQMQYNELAAKAVPSTQKDSYLTADRDSNPYAPNVEDINDNGVYQPAFDYRSLINLVPSEEYVLLHSQEIPEQKKIILEVTEASVNLGDISEIEFDKMISESGTPITTCHVREIIQTLASTSNPLEEYKRYPNTVQTGIYKGYHIFKQGKKGRILFKYKSTELHVRFGDYYKVYADGRRWRG